MNRAKLKKNFLSYYDFNLLFVVLFLSCFGLVMVYSTSYYSAQLKLGDGAYYMKRQAEFMVIGILLMLWVATRDYHAWARLWFLGWGVSIILMILVNFTSFGIDFNGKKRWLGFNGHALFQPTEFVKVAMILVTAVLISKMNRYLGTMRSIRMIFYFAILPFGLVAMNNLSSGIIIAGIVVGMYLVATREKWSAWLLTGVIAAAVLMAKFGTGLLLNLPFLHQYQLSRILVWNHPEAYPQSGGFQVLQGLYAIGSGGLFGKGLGNSVQKLGFVPEAQNDMIFSIICEELGLFGAVCVILLFLFMLYRFMVIANNAPDLLGSMMVIGVMAQIALQVFLNIAVVTNFIPNTGVSLPFISYGGTALLVLLGEIGIVLGVSRQIQFEAEEEESSAEEESEPAAQIRSITSAGR